MNERCWIWVSRAEEIPPREGRVVEVGGHAIAIFNLGGRFFATTNRCPHKGGPLGDGIVSGDSVVCPLHGWRIDLLRGAVERPANTVACVETYPVRIDDGVIVVGVPAELLDRSRADLARDVVEDVCR
jgi:NAD(P)H-dependent nitrite reductase small subunit